MIVLRLSLSLLFAFGALAVSAAQDLPVPVSVAEGERLLGLLKAQWYEEAHALFLETLESKSSPVDGRVAFREWWADALAETGFLDKSLVERSTALTETPDAAKRPYVQPEVWTPSTPEPKASKPGRVYYVAPDGKDDDDGSLAHPFATVARAQRTIRQLKTVRQYPKGGITVFLRGGTYPMSPGLAFDEYDSGVPGSPVTWRPYKNERPVFDGGWRVPALRPCADRAALARLPASARGRVRCCDVRAAGYAHCEPSDPSVAVPGPVTDLYADGVRLEPVRATGGGGALAALDAPGKWHLDSASGVLYVWPPKDCRELTLSDFSDVFLDVRDLHDVRFGGLTFQNGRFDAVVMKGCSDVRFARNVVRNFGRHAVTAIRSMRIRFTGNVISDCGAQGLWLAGGSRWSLKPSESEVSGNEFSALGLHDAAAAAIRLSGCGMDVLNNRLHDLSGCAVCLEGNDFRVFSNIVERVAAGADGRGAVDVVRDPSYAGLLVSYNLFRDVALPVRLGDNASNADVCHNRFERCGRAGTGAVQICGGRNNRIDGNAFVDCPCGAAIAACEPKRWKAEMEERYELYEKKVNIRLPPFATKYPGIATLDVQVDQVNWIVRNVFIRTPVAVLTRAPGTQVFGNRHRSDETR